MTRRQIEQQLQDLKEELQRLKDRAQQDEWARPPLRRPYYYDDYRFPWAQRQVWMG